MRQGAAVDPHHPSDWEAHGARMRRTRTIAKLWAMARQAGLDKAAVYELLSAAVGRRLQDGFGLTTCTDAEVAAGAQAVARAAGVPWATGRRAAPARRGRPRAAAALRPDGELRASLPQLQFLRTLTQELHWSEAECHGHFRQACGRAIPQSARDFARCIEMATQVKARRLAAARRGDAA
jgi:hypothetical protein